MSSPLYRFVYPFLDRTGFFRFWDRKTTGLRVVTYHGATQKGKGSKFPELDGNLVTPEQLRDQIKAFQRDYDLVEPVQVREWASNRTALPKRALLLTCDDGLVNNLSEMLPVLIETHSKAIFFCTAECSSDEPKYLWHEELYAILASATSGRLQRAGITVQRDHLPVYWSDLINELGRLPSDRRTEKMLSLAVELGVDLGRVFEFESAEFRHRLMTRAEVRGLHDSGMTIGSHSVSHALLAKMSDDEVLTELQDSKSRLEQVIGEQVWALSYPFGGIDDAGNREWEIARRVGYAFGVMNISMEASHPLNWGRINSGAGSTVSSLNAYLSGFHQSLRKLLK